jgi:diadenosine tetraphosphate (Ap4A) HIT family hydrolase
MDCPFCGVESSRILLANDLALAMYDGCPVSPGHCLIIPRRHIASFFDATGEEQAALVELLGRARAFLARHYDPDGFNVGINDGEAAGQTIMHLHIHLIPRYRGDVHDPRGGVRWIFPAKAPYWEQP